MVVVYLSHPRYPGMTFIPFLKSPLTGEEVTMPKFIGGQSSSFWIIPGTMDE